MSGLNNYISIARCFKLTYSAIMVNEFLLNNVTDSEILLEDAPSLTLRSSLSSLGLHVHIAKPRRDLEKIMKSKNLVLLSESASTKSYFYQVRVVNLLDAIARNVPVSHGTNSEPLSPRRRMLFAP
jgi:hypothetical protein